MNSAIFFQSLLGWEIRGIITGLLFSRRENLSIGLLLNPKAVLAGESPNLYLLVDSIEDTFRRAVELGGGSAYSKVEVSGFSGNGFVKSSEDNLGLQQQVAG
jgi:predicted enzyme related to lactoylglutathione lyase